MTEVEEVVDDEKTEKGTYEDIRWVVTCSTLLIKAEAFNDQWILR